MIVKVAKDGCTVYFIAQAILSEADQTAISKLNEARMLVNMGRDCDGDYIHAEVKLARPETNA